MEDYLDFVKRLPGVPDIQSQNVCTELEFLLAPVWIAFGIRNPCRFLLGDSSLFPPVGVYLDCSFARKYIFPCWGFSVLIIPCRTTYIC